LKVTSLSRKVISCGAGILGRLVEKRSVSLEAVPRNLYNQSNSTVVKAFIFRVGQLAQSHEDGNPKKFTEK